MTYTTEVCIRNCSECATLCRRAAEKCRTMLDIQEWVARFEECEQASNRAVGTMDKGGHEDCGPCADVCQKIVDDLRIYDYQFTEDLEKACQACVDSCRDMAKMDGGSKH